MKKYNYKSLLKQAFMYVDRAVGNGFSLKKTAEGLKKIISDYSGLTRNEKSMILSQFYRIARSAKSQGDKYQEYLGYRTTFDKALVTVRKVQMKKNLREKRIAFKLAISGGETIFFLCSVHDNCAEDHIAYQGKVYYDRFWRQKVSGEWYRAVNMYIKKHNLMSVQEVMGEPVYMTTRPYCKHFFIPLDTATVLGNSMRKVKEQFGKRTRGQFGTEEYYELRSEVYTILNEQSPCKSYQSKKEKR